MVEVQIEIKSIRINLQLIKTKNIYANIHMHMYVVMHASIQIYTYIYDYMKIYAYIHLFIYIDNATSKQYIKQLEEASTGQSGDNLNIKWLMTFYFEKLNKNKIYLSTLRLKIKYKYTIGRSMGAQLQTDFFKEQYRKKWIMLYLSVLN